MERIVPLLAQKKEGGTGLWISRQLYAKPKTVSRALHELAAISADEWIRKGVRAPRSDEPREDAIVRFHPIRQIWYHRDHHDEVARLARLAVPPWEEIRRSADAERTVRRAMKNWPVRVTYAYLAKRPSHRTRRWLERQGVDFSSLERFVRTYPRTVPMQMVTEAVFAVFRRSAAPKPDEIWEKPLRLRDEVRGR